MFMPPGRAVPLVLAVVALTAACSGAEDAGALGSVSRAADATDTDDLPPSLTGQTLDWSHCEAPDSRQGDDETSPSPLPDPDGEETVWECATLTAPLDYADPEGETIGIAMIRARATTGDGGDGGDRIGSLLFNFGGPGGSGVATLPAFGQDYAALRERYDLVSFDPRGVGESEGLVCLDDQQLDDYFAAPAVPDGAAESGELQDRLRRFADACEERAGDLLPHLTTANTARDMDLMREVLGDDTLHYFGVSYGTQLGGVYAHLFPRRVGRAVFDAVVDPALSPKQAARAQAGGFQRALGNYVEACAGAADEEDQECPLGDTTEQAGERLTALLDRLRETPMATRDPDGRRLTQSLAWNGIAQSLYSRDFWPYLTQGLDDALAGEDPDGTVLLALGDALNGRNPDGTYTTLQSSLTAISCADSSERYDAADARRAERAFHEVSPVFGAPLAWSLLNCSHWPVKGAGPPPTVHAPDAPPILLIGTTGDPATPYEGTRSMKEALGPGVGVVLTYEGEGHGAYTGGSGCVRDAANAYLLDGKVPESGTTCED